jgi:hypothetical protein
VIPPALPIETSSVNGCQPVASLYAVSNAATLRKVRQGGNLSSARVVSLRRAPSGWAGATAS